MNVIFHTIASVATAAVLSSRLEEKPIASGSGLAILAVGSGAGILLHGVLDLLPHQYPLPSALDVIASLALFLLTFVLARKNARWILSVCFLGAIFPDLVDLGPAIVNQRMHAHWPVVKIFPWHWKEYSGSIYDRSRAALSIFNQVAVTAISGWLICRFRRSIFRHIGTAQDR